MTIGGDKRKMKTQIVAILAIVTVITALITISAVSNDVGYNVSSRDAIDISIESTAVIEFLNATNMTTVHIYNFKGYKGENTWLVQWSSSNRLLDVYVNVATGDIVRIEAKTAPVPTPTPTLETKTWHPVIMFSGREDETTSSFTIRGDVWRVKWRVGSCTEYHSFSVFVYPMGELVQDVKCWSCSKDTDKGTEYLYRGADDYYFEIVATNLYGWDLEVEDYY
ncbi:hypothetical protein C5S53_03325 [Methanophagales archaeon]|nr:hypothetical protein C5S53_03325 [Methanophagales archaeon]